MRYSIFFFIWIFPLLVSGQALQDINYNYLYSPGEKFSFLLKPIRIADEWHVLYQLELRGQDENLNRFAIQWERRERLSDKEGVILSQDSSSKMASIRNKNLITGKVILRRTPGPTILVARVIDGEDKRAWLFYEFLRPDYPATGHLVTKDGVNEIKSFITAGQSYSIEGVQTGSQSLIVSHYTHDFPPSAPAFSEALARVTPAIRVDSTFYSYSQDPILFQKEGLYLVQRDTAATEGIAFRVYNDYPKYARLENLVDPLVYVSTRQEFERLKQSRGDKKAFDRVILNMTGNAERARNFMRSYFRRVELANLFFGSYKEGWKTDRGMIYIIFGLPDEVYRFTDREVWSYKNALYKVTFDFTRSGTLFDPDNYVLIRSRKFQDTWYEVIDLWRNARF